MASLTPSNTEIVAFLGRVDEIVAVDTFSDWPPEVEQCTDLGPDLDIDVDTLIELDVDLVLAAESVPGMEAVTQALAERGLEHLVLAPESLEEVIEDVLTIGRALDASATAQTLAAGMREGIEAIESLTREREPVRVFWEWWPEPVITAGGIGWTRDLIDAAGGVNVFDKLPQQSQRVELSQVIDAEPEVIVMCWQGTLAPVQDRARLHQREGWDQLDAVENDRILELPEALYGRPGPRLVEGLRHLAKGLHPDLEDLPEPYAWVPPGIRDELPLEA